MTTMARRATTFRRLQRVLVVVVLPSTAPMLPIGVTPAMAQDTGISEASADQQPAPIGRYTPNEDPGAT